jgi:hypothetical protein
LVCYTAQPERTPQSLFAKRIKFICTQRNSGNRAQHSPANSEIRSSSTPRRYRPQTPPSRIETNPKAGTITRPPVRASTSMVSVLTAKAHMPRTSYRSALPLLDRAAGATKAIRRSITVEQGLRGVRCVHTGTYSDQISAQGAQEAKGGFLICSYEPYILHIYCQAKSLPTESALSSPLPRHNCLPPATLNFGSDMIGSRY